VPFATFSGLRADREIEQHRADDWPARLLVRNGIAALDAVDGADLAEALGAIPGTVVSVRRMAWALRIGPERAYSLAQIVERLRLLCDKGSRHALNDIAARRDPGVAAACRGWPDARQATQQRNARPPAAAEATVPLPSARR
jgi:hypothetical protein